MEKDNDKPLNPLFHWVFRVVFIIPYGDLSRFGRDYVQSGYYIEKVFDQQNIRYIAVDDGVDTLRGNDSILMPIKNVINDLYAKDISRKTKAAFNAKAKAGQFISSKAAYGYKKSPQDKHKLIVDEQAAETVRMIFRLAGEGNGYNKIARTLQGLKISNPITYFIQNNPDFYQNANYIN